VPLGAPISPYFKVSSAVCNHQLNFASERLLNVVRLKCNGIFCNSCCEGTTQFCLELGKTASKAEDTEPEFAVLNLKSNSSLSSGNLHPHHARRGEASHSNFKSI